MSGLARASGPRPRAAPTAPATPATPAAPAAPAEDKLTPITAPLARRMDCVCVFVNDDLQADTVRQLAEGGTGLVALRCAGFDRVDLTACREHGVTVARVPAYSPGAIAEHAVGLMLALNRKLHRAYSRTREGNFALDGLVGFNMEGRTVGVVGTGGIGARVCEILRLGFGCRVLAYDVGPSERLAGIGVEYRELDEVLAGSDVVSLHVPLLPSTERMIDSQAIRKMRRGAMLINVSRGGLIDTDALIRGLEDGQLGAVGLDVYEQESSVFFEDWSATTERRMSTWDRRLSLLTSFPNVIVTPHR